MTRRLLLCAVTAACGIMAASAQQKYEIGNPQDELNYGYLKHYLPLKQYIDREAYPNFKLGLAIAAVDYLNGGTVKNVTNKYFDETVTGNAMKMSSCVASDGSMNFTTVKSFVNSATTNGLNVYGHTLAWHSQQPTGYLNNLIKDRKPESFEGNTTVWIDLVSKDFTQNQSLGWTADKNTYGFTTDFDDDGLHVTTTKKCNSWEVQYIAMDNIPTEKDVSYRLTFTIKGSKSGTMHCKLGDWGSGPSTSFKFTNEWQEKSVTLKSTTEGSFLLLQHGDYVGDLWVKNIKVEQQTAAKEVTEERRCLVIKATARQSDSWDNQFWLVPGSFKKGDKYVFSAEVRADKDAKASTQIHNAPTNYVDWQAIGDVPFTTEWKTVTASGTFAAAGQSIAFNLNELYDANDYYFDNISLKINGKECIKNGDLEGDDVSSFAWKQLGGGVLDVAINTEPLTYIQLPQPIPLSAQEKHDTLVYAMDRWIKGIMDATQGKVKAWDVVNEAISGGGADSEGVYALQHDNGSGDFFWQDHMGDLEYVRQAVRLARKYYAEAMAKKGGDDGQLRLFVNDYNLESDWDGNQKLKSLIKWIERWEADGVTHIDGIGSQMHISCYMDANTQSSKKKAIENSFKLMAATGKMVRISELDMGMVDASGKDVPTGQVTEAMHKRMANLYEWIVKTYLKVVPPEQQWGICQWCATDSPSGSGWRADTPVGLWTLDWYRKHTYAGVARGLGAPADPTAIMEVESVEPEDMTDVYDITGRRVGSSLQALPSGLYVVNGHKVMKK